MNRHVDLALTFWAAVKAGKKIRWRSQSVMHGIWSGWAVAKHYHPLWGGSA